MKQTKEPFFASDWGVILVGAVIGFLGPILQHFGNPKNMGICMACFERDIAGALGLHRAAAVQYLRPEIPGFVLGAFIAAVLFHEFQARGGSAPMIRFVLGFFAMIGALAFLGCPWRAWFRLAGGDLNGLVGIIGLAAGIYAGTLFLKNGFSLGRSYKSHAAAGLAVPLIMLVLLLLAIFKPMVGADGTGPIFSSEKGPGSMHAPLILSLCAGLMIGFLAQRTRFCTMGAFRDAFLFGDLHLLKGILALGLTAFAVNLILGQFHPGYRGMPVAHSDLLWNLIGMILSGLAYCLAGGCAGRQLFMSGEGDMDAGIFVTGMITGAAFAHNFGLAGSPDAVTDGVVKVGGISGNGKIAVIIGLAVCILIGLTMKDKTEAAEIPSGKTAREAE